MFLFNLSDFSYSDEYDEESIKAIMLFFERKILKM